MEIKSPEYVIALSLTEEGPQYKKVYLDENGERVIEDLKGPLSAIVEVTGKCNLECAICLNNSGPSVSSKQLSFERICTLIDELSALSTTSITLSGGECFLRKDIFDIFEYARTRMPVTFSTNGTLLTEKTVGNLLEDGIAGVIVDIHSCNQEIHDHVTGVKGSFTKAHQGVKTCLEAGIPCSIDMTVTKMNMSTLEETIDFAYNLGVDMVVNKFIPTGRGKVNREKLELTQKEYKKVLSLFYEKQKALKDTMRLQFDHIPYESLLLDQNTFTGCDAGLNVCKITPEGEVHACPFLPVSVGNVLEQSFTEIWQTTPSTTLQKLRKRQYLKGKCSVCDHRTPCGGCRAFAYACTDDFLEEDPSCIVA